MEENQKNEATEKFKLISEAFSVLSNPKRRAFYDKHGMTEEDAENGDFDGFGSFFDAHFKNEFMNFNFMDDEDDMMDFMEHLSNE